MITAKIIIIHDDPSFLFSDSASLSLNSLTPFAIRSSFVRGISIFNGSIFNASARFLFINCISASLLFENKLFVLWLVLRLALRLGLTLA